MNLSFYKSLLNSFHVKLNAEAGTSADRPKTFSKKVCMHHFLPNYNISKITLTRVSHICVFWLYACICKPNKSKRYLTDGKSQLRRKAMKRLRRP